MRKEIILLSLLLTIGISNTISDCATLNLNNTEYQLAVSITDHSGSNCMVITGENVTLDCQGFTIDGTGSYWAVDVQASGAVIKNCILQQWDRGIDFRQHLSRVKGQNLTIQNMAYAGIRVGDSMGLKNSNFTNITFQSCDSSVLIENSDTAAANLPSNLRFENITIGGTKSYGILLKGEMNHITINNTRITSASGYDFYSNYRSSSYTGSQPDHITVSNAVFKNKSLVARSEYTTWDNVTIANSPSTGYVVFILSSFYSTFNRLNITGASAAKWGVLAEYEQYFNMTNSHIDDAPTYSYYATQYNSLKSSNHILTNTTVLGTSVLEDYQGTFTRGTFQDIVSNSTSKTLDDATVLGKLSLGVSTALNNVSINGTSVSSDSTSGKEYASVTTPPAGGPADRPQALGKYVNITNNTAFTGSYVFKIHYTDQDAQGKNESNTKCYSYNTTSGQWEYVNSTVNETGNYVECNTTHFSVFGAFSSAPAGSPPNVTLESPANGTTTQQTSLEFNYTPSDDYGLENCSLWANFTGTWQINQTDSSPVNGTTNTFTVTGISPGAYAWNVQCYDIAGQEGWAPDNYTLIIQSTGGGGSGPGQTAGSVTAVVSAPGYDAVTVLLLFITAAAVMLAREQHQKNRVTPW